MWLAAIPELVPQIVITVLNFFFILKNLRSRFLRVGIGAYDETQTLETVANLIINNNHKMACLKKKSTESIPVIFKIFLFDK